MDEKMKNPPDLGLVVEGGFPLRWHEKNSIGDPDILETQNIRMLQLLNVMEEQPVDQQDSDTEYHLELRRMEAKVDLLLQLVSELIHREVEGTSGSAEKLGRKGVVWLGSDVEMTVGSEGYVELGIDNRLPEALKLKARIIEVSLGKITAEWCFERTSPVLDLFEQFIFRLHRRQIAAVKSRQLSGL